MKWRYYGKMHKDSSYLGKWGIWTLERRLHSKVWSDLTQWPEKLLIQRSRPQICTATKIPSAERSFLAKRNPVPHHTVHLQSWYIGKQVRTCKSIQKSKSDFMVFFCRVYSGQPCETSRLAEWLGGSGIIWSRLWTDFIGFLFTN